MKKLVWEGGERRIPKNYEGFSALKNSCVMARLRYVLPYLKMSQIVVDIGSGTGWNTKYVSLYCSHIYGIDNSAEAIEYSKGINDSVNITWVQEDMCKLDFIETDSIDFIMSIAAIEHITRDDMISLFSDSHRILKSGGFFVGTTTAFRKVSKVDATKWHKYEPSIEDLKKIVSPYFEVIKMENFKLNTPDLVREYTEGMFSLKKKEK